ncbi:MAG: alkaline phosphatase family protein [Streptosporangiales bacterium]|nr:alkaline phosphatase family protein [Streptosporangiales bacterium]
MPPEPPRYGEASLADLSASLLAALGVPGLANPLALPPAERTCLLVIDGLGWELLRAHPEHAPFLTSLMPGGRPLTAGFPATTATSLTSLGTAVPPGGHGMLGYQVAVPGTRRLLNCLRWDRRVDPKTWQSTPTVFQRAAAAGVAPSYVAAGAYDGSGLSVASARGAGYVAADSLGALTARAAAALRAAPRTYVQVYHSDLDATGHRQGCGSEDWALHLEYVDLLAERLAARLPAGARLYVTADHGMVDVTDRVAVDADPDFTHGVRLLGGEPRARHVYAYKGAAADVLAAWREALSGRAWVRSRDEAITAGWFGDVRDELRARIGDVVAVPWGRTGLVAPGREKPESALVGMHGSLVREEQLVPLLVTARD